MTNEKIFAEGFSFKRQENAPDFVVGRLSMKVDEAIAFLRKHEKNEWVNISIKYGRSGNPYCELDTYEAKTKGGTTSKPLGNIEKNFKEEEINEMTNDFEDDLPF
jgi:hypothetical protein